MTRVVLGPRPDGAIGLFISKPGFDALTTSSENMIFDSRLGNYGAVFMAGSATAGSTVNFGTTLPYIPLVSVMLLSSSNLLSPITYNRSKTAGELGGATSGRQVVRLPYYRVTTSQLEILSPTWYGDSGIHSYTVRYIVWRMTGG